MGATGDALRAGSIDYVLVVAIEGYPFLITNTEDFAAVVTAWAGTDWTQAIGGLHVDLENKIEFDLRTPFPEGGDCTLYVTDETNDQLGTDMGRTAGGAATVLTATAYRDGFTFNVKRADDFPAAPAEAYIGNECFEYSAKTSTTFTVSIRGKYSPFVGGEIDSTHFARHHRVAALDLVGQGAPTVSQYRRVWEGAWVGVWMHRVVGGVLDTKAEAQLIYAGQLAEHSDEANGARAIHLDHALSVIRDTLLMRDQYSATITSKIYLETGWKVIASDNYDGLSFRTTNTFSVVASGAAGANQIDAGDYTAEEILAALNNWLASELAAGRLYGNHTLTISDGNPKQISHTHRFASATSQWNASLGFNAPAMLRFLGTPNSITTATTPYFLNLYSTSDAGSSEKTESLAETVSVAGIWVGVTPAIPLTDERGVFFDNSAYLPNSLLRYYDGTNQIGLFLLDGKTLITGYVSAGILFNARLVQAFDYTGVFETDKVFGTRITQIAVIAGSASLVLAYIFGSSGTLGYNSPEWDVLPYGLGLNLPPDLVGTGDELLLDDAPGIPQADLELAVWIRRPMKLTELIEADLVLRGVFLTWRDQRLRFAVFETPTLATATLTLDESNKAEPPNVITSQKSTTAVDRAIARPVVKINFDFSLLEDKFNGEPLVLEDRDAIGAIEDAPSMTINARNLGSGDYAAQEALRLVPEFFSRWNPFGSRPQHRIKRSISPALYEGYGPGTIVLLTDGHARDPATGRRGVTQRPGVIISHTYNLGGFTAPGMEEPQSPQGEVEVLVLPTNHATIWSPAAEVDETVSGGGFSAGYNSGTKVLRAKAHVHSRSGEAADAASFETNDVIQIIEIDPPFGSSPLSWTRTVASQSGNDVTMTATLSAPAWDPTKRYRITSAIYTSAQASQQTDAYLADAGDGMILNTAPAYEYGLSGVTARTDDLVHTDLAELDGAGSSVAEGQPLDTGFHLGAAKTVNNLVDHKTAHQGPGLVSTAMVYSSLGSPTFVLVECKQRWFGGAIPNAAVHRALAVAPFFRSDNGSVAQVRVTISAELPVQSSTDGSATFLPPYDQVTFNTPATTTWGTATEDLLDLRCVDEEGFCWISIEVTGHAQTLGLGQCIERERT